MSKKDRTHRVEKTMCPIFLLLNFGEMIFTSDELRIVIWRLSSGFRFL